jgi:hypothetical protein
MSECPECQRLKCRVDLAAVIAVQTAAHFLNLPDDSPECSVAIVVTRRAKSTLEECELEYEAHMAGHAHRARFERSQVNATSAI